MTEQRLAQLFLSHSGNVSDKWEHYLPIYDAELARFIKAQRPVRLLEIGIQNGGSLQIWKQFLPEGSSVTGIDIDARCADLALGDGINVLIGNAADRDELDRLLGDMRFDIIIDDGSHRSDDIIATFHTCFPRVAGNGLYIVEDLHCSYFASHDGGFRKRDAAIEVFKALIDAINADHFESDATDLAPPETLAWMKGVGRSLARVTFYDSLVVLERQPHDRAEPYRRIITGRQSPIGDLVDGISRLPVEQLHSLILTDSGVNVLSPKLCADLAAMRAVASAQAEVHQHQQAEIQALHMANATLLREAEALRRLEDNLNEKLQRVEADLNKELRSLEASKQATEAEVERLQIEVELRETENQRLEAEIQRSNASLSAAQQNELDANWRLEQKIIALDQAAARANAAEMRARAIELSTFWRATALLRRTAQHVPPSLRRGVRQSLRRLVRGAAIEPALAASSPSVADLPPQAGQKQDAYELWRQASTPSEQILQVQRRMARTFGLTPTISVVVPVYRTPPDIFAAMVQSVQQQSYEAWELCLAIADTGDDAKPLIAAATACQAEDARIKVTVLERNEGIAQNSNSAFALATGDWVALLDHDDLLTRDALFEVARAINRTPDASLIYSDKDQIDRDGISHSLPLFKPSWSPDTLLNANYLTHLCAIPAESIRRIGGWDQATDGAQDWDLFLRVIDLGGPVVHIPKVLYHWRQVESSVSLGGLQAKPYAAEGQLCTLRKHLPAAGWNTAEPVFHNSDIRIVWGDGWQPSVTVVVAGGPPLPAHGQYDFRGSVEVVTAEGPGLSRAIDACIKHAASDVIVLVDSRYAPADGGWLKEMVLPLANPAVALVAGRVLDEHDRVVDFGVWFENGVNYPVFRGEPRRYFGPGGACGWYRNAIAASGGALAFRRSVWADARGFGGDIRPDLQFCLSVHRRGLGRLMLNPFAEFRSIDGSPSCFETASPASTLPRDIVLAALPGGDPFRHPDLTLSATGAPTIRLTERKLIAPHDFGAEAAHVAHAMDTTEQEITDSRSHCAKQPAGPLRRVLWIIPEFEVAFYGGIYTILRNADNLRRLDAAEVLFAVQGDVHPEVIRARIAQALPDLAAAADVVTFTGADVPATGIFDAAFCTLWTTAFPLLRLRNVRRKFYFVQDWEPLFYPAGTISSAVEATYRFGFHAICNTPSLAESYRALGGNADWFLPAVDASVFHARGRRQCPSHEPFLLVCYARPGTPRNCFETIAEACRLLKQRYGQRIEIVAAGAGWHPSQFGLDGIITNLGLLEYAETGALYRSADAALIAMATRHPSYLPFEAMACGAAVVTNRNEYTKWFLHDQENCLLSEMTRSSIADAVARVLEQPGLRDSLAANGLETIESHHKDWEKPLAQVRNCIKQIVES